MGKYFNFYFGITKQELLDNFFGDYNPFGINEIKPVDGSMFLKSADGKNFSLFGIEKDPNWRFYGEMEKTF